MKKSAFLSVFLGISAATVITSAGCRRDDVKTVNVVGSTSVLPFAELLAQAYDKQNPGKKVEVQGGGTAAGIHAVSTGLADIGMCSRLLGSEESTQYTTVVVARDGLTIVVNPANSVSSLKTEQIRDIFSGKIKNWKEVGGKDQTIHAITREEGSGTRESFVHLVMGKDKIANSTMVQESNGSVKELVKGDSAAIGYMSLGQVGQELKGVVVDGVEPTAAKVLEGKYKLARPFLFITKGPPNPDAKGFIDFVLSPESQKILETEGLIRAK